MANGYKNTVPLGQVGTGAAYVLGPNMALQQWMGNVQQDQGMRLQAEQRNADINRRNFDAFNQRMAGLQTQSRMYRDDLNELLAGIVDEGAQMMSQGENPFSPDYNNPDSIQKSQNFLREVSAYEAAKSTVEQYETARNTAMKNWQDKPDDFDYDSFLEIAEFEKNNTIADIIQGRAELPSLRRAFDMSGFVSKNVGVPSTTVEEYQKGEDGVDRKVTVKEPDIARLRDNIVNSFRGGQGANYLTRQLRQAGIEGDASGIMGTTDVEEIREMLDENFRTPAEGNQVGQLIASGQIPSLNSPEYEQFLNDSVTEQLRAEQVAARVFNQAAQVALGAADTSYTVTPTFDLEREARARRADQRAAQSSAREQVRFNERQVGDDSGVNYEGDLSVPVGSESRDNIGTVTARNAISLHNSSVNLTGGGAYNLRTRGEQRDSPSISGQIVNLGEYPFDAQGNLLDDSQVASATNVEYRKMAHIREGTGSLTSDLLVPADRIPVNSLSKDKRGVVNSFLGSGEPKSSTAPAQSATRSQIKASEQTLNLFR